LIFHFNQYRLFASNTLLCKKKTDSILESSSVSSYSSVLVGDQSIFVLYILRSPINFSSSNIGYFFAELNGLKFIGASLINYICLHKLSWSDNRILMVYCIASIGANISFAVSNTPWHIFVCK